MQAQHKQTDAECAKNEEIHCKRHDITAVYCPMKYIHTVGYGQAKAEVLLPCQLGVEVAFIRNYSYQMPGSLGTVRALDTTDADCPAVRSGQACQHVYCCGLAGAIGTKKAE